MARMADIPIPFKQLWDPHTCPEPLLPGWPGHCPWTPGAARGPCISNARVLQQPSRFSVAKAALKVCAMWCAALAETSSSPNGGNKTHRLHRTPSHCCSPYPGKAAARAPPNLSQMSLQKSSAPNPFAAISPLPRACTPSDRLACWVAHRSPRTDAYTSPRPHEDVMTPLQITITPRAAPP